MIPILYESNETVFASNGLGRLRDMIACEVTEERNSVYELEFQYPVNGQNYDKIQLGRIVAVEHDDTNDVQPFDIVSCSRPINGVVTFHAVHISYRLRGVTAYGTNIDRLADAFTVLSSGVPSNPFTYETDKSSLGYASAFDGVPRSVRSLLGGVEGARLDAYGGEDEWDKFRVILHENRGQNRNFTVRYGVNLVDYNEDVDYSETYTSVIPYWVNSTDGTVVKASKVSSGQLGLNGSEVCVPLDLTDKFETQPTTAQLTSMAQSYLASNQPYMPAQTIKVDFVRLQDSPEYAYLAPLLTCQLCDTIKVEMPLYGTSGRFKIVKTVYNVLLERFEEMELGKLSTTLSEALGIAPSGSTERSVVPADYVVDYGTTTAGWIWTKWNSGRAECYGNFAFDSITVTTSSAGTYWANSGIKSKALPSGLFTSVACAEISPGNGTHSSGVYPYDVNALSTTEIKVQFRAFASTSNGNCPAFIKVYGSWR